jgi:hypothetical protein
VAEILGVRHFISVCFRQAQGEIKQECFTSALPCLTASHCIVSASEACERRIPVSDHSTPNHADEYVHCTTGLLQELLQAKPGRDSEGGASSTDRVCTYRRAHARVREFLFVRRICVLFVWFATSKQMLLWGGEIEC